jgi:hypothetical protein
MSDFGSQAWDEGFDDENDYLENMMDEAVKDYLNQDDWGCSLSDLTEFQSREISKIAKVGERYRFLTSSDYTIAEFDYIGDNKYRFVKIMNNNKWGFFDSGECRSSEIIYDEVGDFLFEKRNIEDPSYLFDNALLSVNKNGLWGFLNVELKEIIPCQYQEYKNLIFAAYSHRLRRIGGENRNILTEFDKNAITSNVSDNEEGNYFKDSGIRIIVKKDDRWGIIDSNNFIILPFIYDEITKIEYSDFKLISLENEEIIIKLFDDNNSISCNTKKTEEVICSVFPFKSRIGNKIGLINCLGEERVPCIFDEFIKIKKHSFLIESKINDKIGLIHGEEILLGMNELFGSNRIISISEIGDVFHDLYDTGDKNELIKRYELLPCSCEEFDFSFSEQYKKADLGDDCNTIHSIHVHFLVNKPISLHPSSIDYIKYRIDKKWGYLIINKTTSSWENINLFSPEFDKIETRDYCDFIALKNHKWKIHTKSNGFYDYYFKDCIPNLYEKRNSHEISTYLSEEVYDELLDTEFDEIKLHPFGYFIVKKENKYGLIDKFGIGVQEGFYLLKPEYDRIEIKFIGDTNGRDYYLILFHYNDKWGFRYIFNDTSHLGYDEIVISEKDGDSYIATKGDEKISLTRSGAYILKVPEENKNILEGT